MNRALFRSSNSDRRQSPPLSHPAKTYLVAFTVTNTGVGGFTLAVGLSLFAATGTATAFSIAIASEYLLGLAGQLIGGSILDRLPPLPIAFICNTVRGLAALLGGTIVLMSGSPAPAVVVFLFVSMLRPIYRAASFALVGLICHPDEIVRVNSIRFGLLQTAQIGGLALVSALNTITGAASALVGVAALFLAGSALLLPLRAHVQTVVPAQDLAQAFRSVMRSIIITWRELGCLVRAVPTMVLHLVVGAIAPLVASLTAVLVAPVAEAFNAGALGIAALDGGATLGALSAVVLSRRILASHMPLLLVSSILLSALGLSGVGLSINITTATTAFAVLGLSIALGATASDTMLQLRSDKRLLGRIAISQEFATSIVAVALLPAFGLFSSSAGYERASLVYAGILGGILLLVFLGLALLRDRLFSTLLTILTSGTKL